MSIYWKKRSEWRSRILVKTAEQSLPFLLGGSPGQVGSQHLCFMASLCAVSANCWALFFMSSVFSSARPNRSPRSFRAWLAFCTALVTLSAAEWRMLFPPIIFDWQLINSGFLSVRYLWQVWWRIWKKVHFSEAVLATHWSKVFSNNKSNSAESRLGSIPLTWRSCSSIHCDLRTNDVEPSNCLTFVMDACVGFLFVTDRQM